MPVPEFTNSEHSAVLPVTHRTNERKRRAKEKYPECWNWHLMRVDVNAKLAVSK